MDCKWGCLESLIFSTKNENRIYKIIGFYLGGEKSPLFCWEAGRRKMPDYVLRLILQMQKIPKNKRFCNDKHPETRINL